MRMMLHLWVEARKVWLYVGCKQAIDCTETRSAMLRVSLCGGLNRGDPGGTRTPNTQFRRLVLYPLSYWAIWLYRAFFLGILAPSACVVGISLSIASSVVAAKCRRSWSLIVSGNSAFVNNSLDC